MIGKQAVRVPESIDSVSDEARGLSVLSTFAVVEEEVFIRNFAQRGSGSSVSYCTENTVNATCARCGVN